MGTKAPPAECHMKPKRKSQHFNVSICKYSSKNGFKTGWGKTVFHVMNRGKPISIKRRNDSCCTARKEKQFQPSAGNHGNIFQLNSINHEIVGWYLHNWCSGTFVSRGSFLIITHTHTRTSHFHPPTCSFYTWLAINLTCKL